MYGLDEENMLQLKGKMYQIVFKYSSSFRSDENSYWEHSFRHEKGSNVNFSAKPF